VRVNASLTRTETLSNPVSLTYGSGLTATGSVNYSVIATNVLPGTGELPLEINPSTNPLYILALGAAILAILALGWAVKSSLPRASVRLFVVIISLAVLAGTLAACLPGWQAPSEEVAAPVNALDPTATLLPFRPAYAFSTPEAVPPLPDFPIPSPKVTITAAPGEPPPDTSAVERLVVPAMNLDTEVKYVPFDGLSWYITGLREEVAWLGETSWPGLGSNTVIAGHITVAGLGNGPFRWLENLKAGDVITLYTDQKVYSYTVRDQFVVEATDVGVTEATVNPQLTLITCTGWDTDLELYRFRRVVVADLTRSDPWVRQGTK
jgi:LPXTG-site transpeptidase (sortase) family protein